MTIILTFKGARFSTFEFGDVTDDEIRMQFGKEKIGTVIYCAGVIKEEPDLLMAFGSEDGRTFRPCAHAPFPEFSDAWDAAVKSARNAAERGGK